MNHLRFSWRNVPRSPFRRFSPSKTNLVFPAVLMINEIIRAVRFTSIKHTLRVISSKRSHIQRGGLVCWFKRLSEKIHFLWVWMNEAPASKKTIKCSSSRQIEIKSKQDIEAWWTTTSHSESWNLKRVWWSDRSCCSCRDASPSSRLNRKRFTAWSLKAEKKQTAQTLQSWSSISILNVERTRLLVTGQFSFISTEFTQPEFDSSAWSRRLKQVERLQTLPGSR